MPKLNDVDLNFYIERYNNGESLAKISKSTNFSVSTLGRKLKNAGVKLRLNQNNLTERQIEEIISRYNHGESVIKIGKDLRHDERFIKSLLLQQGVKLRTRSESIKLSHRKTRKYSINEQSFESITEESAYWTGFLMADGCVTDSGVVSVALQLIDINHLEKFKKFLKSEHPIQTYEREADFSSLNRTQDACKYYSQARISFSSVKIAESLKMYGVTPRKSLSAKVKLLANNRHFWRGVIDGDGSIGLLKRGNIPFLSLIGSKGIIKQFLKFVNCIVRNGVRMRAAKDSTKTFTVNFSANTAAQIVSFLYDNANVYLDRKYEKAQKIKQRQAEIEEKKSKLDALSLRIGEMYLQGRSGLFIADAVNLSSSAVYEHLKRYEKLTGSKIAIRFKEKQALSTAQRYRINGKCKDCGSDVVPNRSRCEFHLIKARLYWRNKNMLV